MNRVIKFRLWDKVNKEMIYLEEPCVEIVPGSHLGLCFSQFPEHCFVNQRCIDDFEVMEFTGLKDRDGKELYEGDRIAIYWPGYDYTVETISYDSPYGYWKYGNNAICELFD